MLTFLSTFQLCCIWVCAKNENVYETALGIPGRSNHSLLLTVGLQVICPENSPLHIVADHFPFSDSFYSTPLIYFRFHVSQIVWHFCFCAWVIFRSITMMSRFNPLSELVVFSSYLMLKNVSFYVCIPHLFCSSLTFFSEHRHGHSPHSIAALPVEAIITIKSKKYRA